MALVNGLCGLSHIITIIIHIHLENECIVQLPHVQVKGCWWESNPSSGIPNKILHFQTTNVCHLQYKMCISYCKDVVEGGGMGLGMCNKVVPMFFFTA